MSTQARRTQADVQAYLVRQLLHGQALTASEAARLLECDAGHTRRALASLHDATVVRVAAWKREILGGPWIAAYAWNGLDQSEDAKHPRKGLS